MAGITQKSGRKGIFFALSALLLASVLIALASGVSDVSSRTRRTATALLDTDFAANAHADAQAQVAKIMSEWANVTCENNSVSISESLPIKAGFGSDLQTLSEFYSQYARANVTVNMTTLAQGSYVIEPQGLEVSHTPELVDFRNPGPGEGGLVRSINMTLLFPAGAIDSAEWDQLSSAAPGTGMNVSVRVMDASYTVYRTFTAEVQRDATSEINISQGGVEVAHVRFYDPSSCQIYHTNMLNLKAMIEMSNPVYVQAHDNITASVGRAAKSAPARIC
ncbi:MAG: hypothetical protein WC506_03400 [Candidatus Micrarchaeia archaeon]